MHRACLLSTKVSFTALLIMISSSAGISVGSSTPAVDWLSQARQRVALGEYHFSRGADGSFVAPNRSQGLRLHATAQGVQLTPRKRDRQSWDLGLALRAVGRKGSMRAAGLAAVEARAETIEQRRKEIGVTEWYVNGNHGIEQGYTLDARPAGDDGESPLVLEIAYTGTLKAREVGNDDIVRFETPDGQTALFYEGLMAVDASGKPVPSSLEVIPGALRISVQDQGHRYPIIVDPTLVAPAWTAYGDQFDERFGASVAGAGDVNGDGYADVLVGAYQYDNGSLFDVGRAFLFMGSATGPAPMPAWTFDGDQTGGWLGYSVASAGDVNHDGYADVIIGSPLYDLGSLLDEGRAFVFLGSASGLGLAPAWTADGGQNGARFGSSVASAGDVNGDGTLDVIVGAPVFDNGQNVDEGRAFAYFGSPGGLSLSPDWQAGSGLASSGYGTAVAAAGDVNGDSFGDIIVGAPLFDSGGFFDAGRTFVYLGSALGPSLSPNWTADGGKNLAKFGQAVAGAGDVNGDGFADLIIGAPTYDSGRVLIYHGSASGPGLTPALTAKINKSPAEFGASVAGVGDVNGDGFSDVAIGAPKFGDTAAPAGGLVRIYYGSRNGVGSQPALVATETQSNAFLGGSVAAAGDVNGDGTADVIAGGIGLDNAALFVSNCGGAEVYLGFRTRQPRSQLGSLHGVRFPD